MARKLTEKEKQDEIFSPIRTRSDSFKERLSDFMSEFKWLVIFGVLFLAAVGWVIGSFFITTPDMKMYVVASEGYISEADFTRLDKCIQYYGYDFNGDGRGLTKLENALFAPDGYTGEDEQSSQAAAYFEDYLNGGYYVLFCSPEVTNYLGERGLYKDLTYYSEHFSSDMYGIRVSDTHVFSRDEEMQAKYADWSFIITNFDIDVSRDKQLLRAHTLYEILLLNAKFENFGVTPSETSSASAAYGIQ